MKHNINDGWVTLRDPKQVAERYRRPIIAKATSMQEVAQRLKEDSENGMDFNEAEYLAMCGFNDLVAVALISEWSYGLPISVDSLLDLPAADYDAILALTAPLLTELMPSFDPNVENTDPQSPTVSSVE